MPVAGGGAAPGRAWLALIPLLTGTFLGTVSNNIVNVPLRDISESLRVPVSRSVLIVVGFTLTFAVSMPIAGWLGDRLGRRGVFCAALAGLAAGALGAALAPDLWVLVAFRVLQGVATGAVLPLVMGMITGMFGPERRGRALGAWAAANGLGQAAGPSLGGALAQLASWRWIFLPIAPLALLALVATVRLVPADRGRPVRLEWRGAVALTAGTGLVIAAATAVAQPGVPGAVPAGLVAAGVVTLGLFVVATRRAALPFVSPRLIHEPSYLRGSLAVLAQMFCLGATLLGVALYLTGHGHESTARAGAVVFAFPATMAVLAPVSGVLVERAGARRVLRCGLLVLAAGQLWLAVALSGACLLPLRQAARLSGACLLPLRQAAWLSGACLLPLRQAARLSGGGASASIVLGLVVSGCGVALVQTPAALGATRSAAGRAGAGLGLFNLLRFAASAMGAAWVTIALGRGDAFGLMLGVCAAVAAAGFLATFAGKDPPVAASTPTFPSGNPGRPRTARRRAGRRGGPATR